MFNPHTETELVGYAERLAKRVRERAARDGITIASAARLTVRDERHPLTATQVGRLIVIAQRQRREGCPV
jgi:hypothetical protein